MKEINEWRITRNLDDGTPSATLDFADFWHSPAIDPVFDEIAKCRSVWNGVSRPNGATSLRENKDDVEKLKSYLDSVQNLLHYAKPLCSRPEGMGDSEFYSWFDPLYQVLENIIPLYNRIRNYMTTKAAEQSKVKLMFDNPTLADGWDLNKESANTAVIFLRDGKYYLGIMNPKNKTDFSQLRSAGDEPSYQKMIYKLLPGPNKMLPKVFFGEKNKNDFSPSATLLENYQAGKYKKGDSFDINFCHELIDFFKRSIEKHKDWSEFKFNFSDTQTYADISEFYKEITEQGYRISFEKISSRKVDELVRTGHLFLFQIYNKDFAAKAKGAANLHTIYWNSLFSPENLQNVIFKLNGEAELFWRDSSIRKPFVHKKGEMMVCRCDSDGNPIPESVFGELFNFVNYKKPLNAEAAALWKSGKVKVREVPHEITKDRRFTEEKLLFHVPITINFKAPDQPRRFNDSVAEYLRNNPDVKIIGIDRGERNLIYLTLIDQKGNILEQKSFNKIERNRYDGRITSFDYHEKLEQRERERDEARKKSWSSIGNIKDLKAGYLSQVVHEITALMVKYNAIIVLEDLNYGFKRGRFRIEKQVYQKFEKALIEKLNYLVFKDRAPDAAGGCLKGYQLTNAFTSFEKLGKQSGFLFYVPAGYTSKIDPTTGFTNLFNTKKCTDATHRKEFFETFESIRYDAERKAFAFHFDYRKFKTGQESWKSDWTVYSADRRLVYDTKLKHEKEIFPTQLILNVLEACGVQTVADGFDLLVYLKGVEPNRSNAEFFSTLFYAFDRTLQMRNSISGTDEDYIQSPVLNRNGSFFDSREAVPGLPENADANGAFHIALKGLFLLQNAFSDDKTDLKIEHKSWFEFAQKRCE